VELALSRLMGAFEKIQVCVSSSRTNRRWYTGTRRKAKKEIVVKNIEAKLIPPSDPGVPAEAAVVFVCDVLHHVADRPSCLAKLAAAMKAGARLVLIEFKEGNLPEGPPEAAILRRICVRRQDSRPGTSVRLVRHQDGEKDRVSGAAGHRRTLHQDARRSRTLEEVVPMAGHS
jgi:hypothetical protein